MGKIATISSLNSVISSIRKTYKTVVLVGGCFDILHIGHIKFLEKAKNKGDVLMILLESDSKVKRLKGENRPLFTQGERAEVLSALKAVDYIILLPILNTDKEYADLILKIKPGVIAATSNDSLLEKKRGQAAMVGGKLEIIPFLPTASTSDLVKLLGID